MRKIGILFLTSYLLTSCYPIKEVFSDTYEIENKLSFKILKYSEPATNASFIRSDQAKYVILAISMVNKSSKAKNVDFTDFFIVNDLNSTKSPLWKVNRGVEVAGTENASVKFIPFETKKL